LHPPAWERPMHGLERMRLFRAVALVAGAFVLLVHAAGAQSVTPSAVVDSYERAWGHQDFEGALVFLAENAVVTLPEPGARSMTNRQQIREYLQNAGLKAAPVVTMAREVDANTVTWSERIQGQVLSATELTVQAVVEDGKITSLVYRSGRMPRGPGGSAGSASLEAAGAVLVALLMLGLGLVSLASVRSHVRSGSNLRGRLISDLRVWTSTPKTS
jgi:hypothetical protein